MKKNTLSTLSLALIAGVLCACDAGEAARYTPIFNRVRLSSGETLTSNSGEIHVTKDEDGEVILINDPNDPVIAGKLTSLAVKDKAAVLFLNKDVGLAETIQIEVDFEPYTADITGLTYSSSNPAVASVSATGLVKAVGEGTCDVTVKSADGFLSSSMHVVVNSSKITLNAATSRKDEILAAQSDKSKVNPTSIYLEIKQQSKRINKTTNTIMKESMFSEKFWISKEDAYFRIVEDDYEVKVSGGSLVPGHVDYIFYTTDSFFSYAFKTATYSKNYMRVDQSSLISTGDPYNGLLEILDNFFTSGKSIVENQIEDAYGADILKQKSDKYFDGQFLQLAGRFASDSGQLAILSDTVHPYQVGADQEDDFEIPAFTPFTVHDLTRALWEDNLLTYKTIDDVWSWNLDGVDYEDHNILSYYVKTKDVELLKPDTKDYNKVDTIFDL